MPRLASLALLLVAVGLAGCAAELGLDQQLFTCTTDRDCAGDFRCQPLGNGEAVCVRSSEWDGLDGSADLDSDAPEKDTAAPDTASDGDSLDTADTTDGAELADATDTTDTTDTTDGNDTTDALDGNDATDTGDTGDTPDGDAPDVIEPRTIQVTSAITADTTWTAPDTYVLTEPIWVRDGATLTIEAGVTVLGEPLDDTEPGALLVARGSQLVAQGTAAAPIVFSSARPPGMRAPGDWYGVALLGRAPTNSLGDNQGYLYWFSDLVGDDDTILFYGGSNHASSCGELRHVRVEFAGYEKLVDDRFPGLLLGGCGHQTVVDHVQVHRAFGNGLGLHGGSAPLRHVLGTAPGWSAVQLSGGYVGSVQFLATWQDVDSDAAVYAMNDYFDAWKTPATNPLVFNASFVGTNWRAMSLRRGTGGRYHNTLLVGQTHGLHLEHTQTIDAALAGDLAFRTSLFTDLVDDAELLGLERCGIWLDYDACLQGCTGMTCPETCADAVATDPAWTSVFAGMTQAELDVYFADLTAPSPDCAAVLAFDPDAWLADPAAGNLFDLDPGLTSRANPAQLHPASASSPVAGAGAAPPAADAFGVPFDTSADYIGAFEPAIAPWTAGWTAFPAN